MLRWIAILLLAAVASLATAADARLLDLLPPESRLIGGINFEDGRGTPFGDYVLSKLAPHGAEIDEFVSKTGFDVRLDLLEIAFGGDGMSRESNGLIVARGRFNMRAITAYAEAKGAQVERSAGVVFISGREDRSSAIAFPGDGIAVLGNIRRVRGAIDRWRAGNVLPEETALKAQSVAINRHAWFLLVGSPAEFAGRVENPTINGAMQGDIIKSIQEISGGVIFGADVEILGEALTATATDAEALGNVARFFLSLAQLTDDEKLADLATRLNANLQLTTTGGLLYLHATLPESDFEQILETYRNIQRRRLSPARGGGTGRSSRPGSGR